MDRVSVVVVVESHTDSALFLGSSISLLSSIPQMLGAHSRSPTSPGGDRRGTQETRCSSTDGIIGLLSPALRHAQVNTYRNGPAPIDQTE